MNPANSAPMVAWLASDEAMHVTGQVFRAVGHRITHYEPWTLGATVETKGSRPGGRPRTSARRSTPTSSGLGRPACRWAAEGLLVFGEREPRLPPFGLRWSRALGLGRLRSFGLRWSRSLRRLRHDVERTDLCRPLSHRPRVKFLCSSSLPTVSRGCQAGDLDLE